MSSRAEAIFFEVFEPLPRQGPGSRACTQRAVQQCTDLPESPRIIDLGCGSGHQTLHLAELTAGEILAVDLHPPNIDRLRERIASAGLTDRITGKVADMLEVDAARGTFDLVWSEGAFYNVGVPAALAAAAALLHPGGYVVFTEAVWRTDDAPDEVQALFADYPAMGKVADVLEILERGGWTLVDHFALPDDAWWDEFYTPMEARIAQLRETYAGDSEALEVLDQLAVEPQLHREHAAHYGYEFFIARR